MKFFSSIIFAIFILSGCASSKNTTDGATIKTEEPTVQTGVFIDAAVAGLTYTTVTQNGVTDVNGTFEYLQDENITFLLGNVVLGNSVAKAQLTPTDVVSEATDSNNTAVTNILRLLQTLDSDKNASNGIDLTKVQNFAFDGNVSTLDFYSDATLNDIVAQAQVDAVIVSAQDALEHFEETLASLDKETIQTNIDNNLTSSDAILWDFVLSMKTGPIYLPLNEAAAVPEALVPLDANGTAFNTTKEQYPTIPFEFILQEKNATKVVWNLVGSADINGTTQSFDFLYTYTKQ